jgi:hypothetical protein
MINSSYFIALTMIDRLILSGGVVICCQLVQPIIMNETFSHAIYILTIKQTILLKPRQ